MKLYLSILVLSLVGCALNNSYKQVKIGESEMLIHQGEAGFLLLNSSNNIQLTTLDKDNDGNIDLLRYSIYNKDGVEVLEVEDSTLNGAINQRWYKGEESYFEILYQDKWYRVHKLADGPYIILNDEKIPVTTEKGYLYPKQ